MKKLKRTIWFEVEREGITRLEARVVESIVRQNLNEITACYRDAGRDPVDLVVVVIGSAVGYVERDGDPLSISEGLVNENEHKLIEHVVAMALDKPQPGHLSVACLFEGAASNTLCALARVPITYKGLAKA